MNPRLLDIINEDEIARRAQRSVGVRIIAGFVAAGSMWAVGWIVGGQLCATVFLVGGCLVAAAFMVPVLTGAIR